MVRPIQGPYLELSNTKYSTPLPIYGIWGSKKIACYGLANKGNLKFIYHLSSLNQICINGLLEN